eukprot:UN05252
MNNDSNVLLDKDKILDDKLQHIKMDNLGRPLWKPVTLEYIRKHWPLFQKRLANSELVSCHEYDLRNSAIHIDGHLLGCLGVRAMDLFVMGQRRYAKG